MRAELLAAFFAAVFFGVTAGTLFFTVFLLAVVFRFAAVVFFFTAFLTTFLVVFFAAESTFFAAVFLWVPFFFPYSAKIITPGSVKVTQCNRFCFCGETDDQIKKTVLPVTGRG